MARVLELPQLVEDDGVSQVKVRRRWINAQLDSKRAPRPFGDGELVCQSTVWKYFDGAHHEVVDEARVDHVDRLRCRVAGGSESAWRSR
jgi:hypothetical protein